MNFKKGDFLKGKNQEKRYGSKNGIKTNLDFSNTFKILEQFNQKEKEVSCGTERQLEFGPKEKGLGGQMEMEGIKPYSGASLVGQHNHDAQLEPKQSKRTFTNQSNTPATRQQGIGASYRPIHDDPTGKDLIPFIPLNNTFALEEVQDKSMEIGEHSEKKTKRENEFVNRI